MFNVTAQEEMSKMYEGSKYRVISIFRWMLVYVYGKVLNGKPLMILKWFKCIQQGQ